MVTLVLLVTIGLIFGSFVNACVWRLYEQEQIKEKHPKDLRKKLKELSIINGRSMCPNCRHQLAGRDLVPVVSWLSLQGKCRYCRKPISWQYPAIELSVAAVFAFSYIFWPFALNGYGLVAFMLWLIFLVGFAILTVCDVRWFWLPDKVVWPLVALAFVQVLVHAIFFGGGSRILPTALWGMLFGSGFFYALYVVSKRLKKEWIGDGDVKLGLVFGLLVGGPLSALLVLYFASIIGTLVSMPLLVNKKMQRTSLVPFGPFLLIATVIVQLFGISIANWISRVVIG